MKLNSVDGCKVCGQPSEQSFKSATGRRCARGTSPESDATRWFGGVRLGGTVDGDVAAAAAPPAARVSHKEGRRERKTKSKEPVASGGAAWAWSTPRAPCGPEASVGVELLGRVYEWWCGRSCGLWRWCASFLVVG